jgi:hypothetical protein
MGLSPLVIDADVSLRGSQSPFPRPAPRLGKTPIKAPAKIVPQSSLFSVTFLYWLFMDRPPSADNCATMNKE